MYKRQTLAGRETEFLSAVRLSAGEARYWQDQGCGRLNCAYLTFYNYSDGGTIEAVINLDRAQVVGQWTNAVARPGGSSEVLPRAMRIAAADALSLIHISVSSARLWPTWSSAGPRATISACSNWPASLNRPASRLYAHDI